MDLIALGIDNRKLALLIWFGVIFVWMMTQREIRTKIFAILRTLMSPKLFSVFLLSAVYSLISIVFLTRLHYWQSTMLADSIFWFFGTAVILTVNAKEMEDSEKFKKRLLEYFSFTIILDFLVNAYGFSLPIELVILPIITLIALLWTVAKWDKKYAPVSKLAGALLIFSSVLYLGGSIIGFFSNLTTFSPLGTLESLFLIPILTAMYIPFVYCTALYGAYDGLFSTIRFFNKEDMRRAKMLKLKSIKMPWLSLKRVNSFSATFYKTYVQDSTLQ